MDKQLQTKQGNQGLTKITPENWLKEYTQLQITAEQVPAEILRIGTPSISTLNAGTGSRENGLLVFETVILSILKWFGQPWDGDQISEVAGLMHSEYHWLHLAELKHFSTKAKQGEYNVKRNSTRKTGGGQITEEYDGKIYGTLSPDKMMKWIAEYANESLITRADININREQPTQAIAARQIEQASTYVAPEVLAQALADFELMKRGGKTPEQEAEDERIYQQERNKQFQRDAIRNQQNTEQ